MAFKKPTIGSGDDNDPEWLWLNTSNDEIALWLATVKPVLDVRAVRTKSERHGARFGDIFSPWERAFFASVNERYTSRMIRGFTDRPLSGKQLFILRQMYERVAALAADALSRSA